MALIAKAYGDRPKGGVKEWAKEHAPQLTEFFKDKSVQYEEQWHTVGDNEHVLLVSISDPVHNLEFDRLRAQVNPPSDELPESAKDLEVLPK